jgi:hypothetical protein
MRVAKFPLGHYAQCVRVNALWDVDTVGHLVDVLERPLDSIKDGAHDSRAEFHREWFACSEDGVADCDAGCVLVHLNDLKIRVLCLILFVRGLSPPKPAGLKV